MIYHHRSIYSGFQLFLLFWLDFLSWNNISWENFQITENVSCLEVCHVPRYILILRCTSILIYHHRSKNSGIQLFWLEFLSWNSGFLRKLPNNRECQLLGSLSCSPIHTNITMYKHLDLSSSIKTFWDWTVLTGFSHL